MMNIYSVFTKKQTMTTMPILELTKRVEEGTIRLRETNQMHVRAIKRYIVENAQQGQLYFPPIVAHLDAGHLADGVNGVLSIVDGSHRVKAFIQVVETMQKAINSEQAEDMKQGYKLHYLIENSRLALQIFEGFSKEEKDQLFIDLNTKGKKVSMSKRISYDSRNHLNQITNNVLQLNESLQKAGVEMEKAAIVRPSNKKLLSLTQLRQIVGIFLTGKMLNSRDELTFKLPLADSEYLNLINSWFDDLFSIFPATMIGDYEESMLASYPLLASIALYANEGLIKVSFAKREKTMNERMLRLKNLDFHSNNKTWEQFSGIYKGRKVKYFYLSKSRTNLNQLIQWLKQGR